MPRRGSTIVTDTAIRTELQEATNIFRVLIKTLVKAGIIIGAVYVQRRHR